MAWTSQQRQAIEERGRNMLVSAAAGSGKTAVMVERIIKMITEEDCSVDEMLIVTFTNAAASEMREKIRRALREKTGEDRNLRKQLDLLPSANISTFHSFSMSVIRRFFFLTDLEPDFSICEEARATILKEEALDDLLDEYYEKDDERFKAFLDRYSGEKSDEAARNVVSDVYRSLQALPEPFETLEKKIAELNADEEQFAGTDAMRFLWLIMKEETARAEKEFNELTELLDEAGVLSLIEKMEPSRKAVRAMAAAAGSEDFEGCRNHYELVEWPKLTVKKSEKEGYEAIKTAVKSMRDDIKDRLKGLHKQFMTLSLREQIAELNETGRQAETLGALLKDFDRIFREKKREKNLVDFNDIEHYCLEILKNPDAADYYRKRFLFIFIDEYQDTSLLQEAIIEKIKRDNNLFMVGDIKQSIYKFRLAEPEIFKDKYDRYAEVTGNGDAEAAGSGDPLSIRVDLNRNFRSKPVILHTINTIFEPVMEDYDDNARLYPGFPYDGEYSYRPELHIVDRANLPKDDDILADLRKEELEALEAVRIIRGCLGRPYFDAKSGETKKVAYRDIVVLMRAVVSRAGIWAEIFGKCGIPLYIDDNEGYFDRIEISVFMNLLSVIDNRYQDVPLISVLRSEVMGFTTDELAEIRQVVPEGSYADAFREVADKRTAARNALAEKCAAVSARLDHWRELSAVMPLTDFIWTILLDSGYYTIAGAMPEGTLRQANLRILVDRAASFSENAMSSLYSFISFVNVLKKRNVKSSQAAMLGENDDVVRLMTIHKSKGLEFPVVITAGMGNRLTYSRSGSGVLFHKDVGLGMMLVNPKLHFRKKTLIYNIILAKIRREEASEHLRILYVALTRAREMLFMTGVAASAEKLMEKLENGLTSDTTYFDMMKVFPALSVVQPMDLIDTMPDLEAESAGFMLKPEAEADPETERLVRERMSFVYPYEEAGKLNSKYSVSVLNSAEAARRAAARRGGQEVLVPEAPEDEEPGTLKRREGGAERNLFRIPEFMLTDEEKKLSFAERGTVYHNIMERIDFCAAKSGGSDYIKKEVGRYVTEGILLQKEADAVNLRKIERFFGTELGAHCTEAFGRGLLRREHSFNLMTPYKGENIMVQGIIDCFFEDDDGIVLIDYKSNWIDRSLPFEEEAARLKEAYAGQIGIYAEALEKGIGKPVKEAYLYLFEAERVIDMKKG